MTHYLLCDLKDDAEAITAYGDWHAPGAVWPEVLDSIRKADIRQMEIFRAGNRLMMVMETGDRFDAAAKAAADAADPTVVRWEALMDTLQRRLPFATGGQKWVPLKRIFQLEP